MTVDRYDFQGAGAGDPGQGDRGPSCRSGHHPRQRPAAARQQLVLYLSGLIGGGWGAKHDSDGMSGTVAINDGDTHNGPAEQIEAKFPLLVERYALRQDSGGAGHNRGGLGVEQVIQARSQIRFHAQMDRTKCRPWGLYGGLAGLGNSVAIHRFGEAEQGFDNGKAFNLVLEPGDAFIKRSGGGGGFGSPLDRDLDRVEDDVRQGYISKELAEKNYGVVFEPGTLAVDRAATPARRDELRAKGLPVDDPVPPERTQKPDGHHHHRHSENESLSDEERLVIALSGRCCS